MAKKNLLDGPETFHLEIPAVDTSLIEVRDFIADVCVRAGFSKRETNNTKLAMDEACTNIIKHAYGGDSSGTIALRVEIGSGEVRIEVRDTGKQADVSNIGPRDLADVRPGGLGTHFMNSVFDTVNYDSSGREGTLLTLIKRL